MIHTATVPVELVISANSLRNADFRSRVHAASEAGFQGIGMRVGDYHSARESGLSDADMRAILADAGLRVFEIEAEWDWAEPLEGERRTMLDTLIHRIPDAFEYRCLNAFVFPQHPIAQLVDGYARLCELAAEAGLIVGLEFIPYSGIPDLPSAEQIVRLADRPNGGLIIDSWHLVRSGGSAATLLELAADDVVSIQLSDVLPQPMADLADEARHHRQIPGQGCGDVSAIVRSLAIAGVCAPVAVEVVNDALDAAYGFGERAQLLRDAAVSLLTVAGIPLVPLHTDR